MMEDWTLRFDGLARLGPEVRNSLLARARVLSVPAGTRIFGPGQEAENMLLLLDGTVRVQQTSETGREIVLYRIRAGESCVLTTACLLSHEAYGAEGIAESGVEAVVIPRAAFDDLLGRSEAFRTFVFRAYARRITDLFALVEEVAFRRVDIRLAQRLLELAGPDAVVRATHQMMAAELGTAREVVSRQLAEFQRRGWVAQARGEIRIVDAAALGGLAEAA